MARKTNSNYTEADQIMLAGWGKSTQNWENWYKSVNEYKNGCLFLPESALLVKEKTREEMDPALNSKCGRALQEKFPAPLRSALLRALAASGRARPVVQL